MTDYIFDIETNGLLDELTKVHCMVLVNAESGELTSYADQPGYRPITDGLELLATADMLIGHNIQRFDLPALKKVYGWEPKAGVVIRDTMVISRVIWPDMKTRDARMAKKNRKFPGKLVGSHNLKAWGHRLGNYKGDYDGGWEHWSPEMHDYMVQDGRLNKAFWDLIVSKQWPAQSLELEHAVAAIIERQTLRGFAFDVEKAGKLYAELSGRRQELEQELKTLFPPWYRPKNAAQPFTPKRPNVAMGYMADCPLTQVVLTHFNPNSRDHIADRFKAKYGWEPVELTDTGLPKIDDEVLQQLDYPEAKPLAELFMLSKRIGQIAEGKKAWLKVEKNGRIHGALNPNGARTGRMTHFDPNLGQVPANDAPYGRRCRELFVTTPGFVLVGCDADGLELRDLAGYMAPFDDGAYIDTVLKGDKAKGTDNHSVNARALGLDPKQMYPVAGREVSGRDIAKTWFYAYIYGAGNEKLGWIMGVFGPKTKVTRNGEEKLVDKKALAAGKKSRENFEQNLPALGRLVDAVKAKSKQRKWLKGLDGRRIPSPSQHSALNTLLQSAGAVQMKQALVILDGTLQRDLGFVPGVDYEFVANVHDEWQIEARPEIAQEVADAAKDAIRRAGEHFNFACPLAGNAEIGTCWAETH